MTNLPSSYTNSSIKLSISPSATNSQTMKWNSSNLEQTPQKLQIPFIIFFLTNLLISHTPNLNLELTNPAESNHQHTNNKRRKALINQNSPTQVQSTAEQERRRLRRLSQTLGLSDSDLFRFFYWICYYFSFWIGF